MIITEEDYVEYSRYDQLSYLDYGSANIELYVKNRLTMNDLSYHDKLIDQVLEQIQNDISDGDLTAIAELLTFVPIENLEGYLPEKL
jgi:hypothetical protein